MTYMKGSISTIYILRYRCLQFTFRCLADQQRVIFLCYFMFCTKYIFSIYAALTGENNWIVISHIV